MAAASSTVDEIESRTDKLGGVLVHRAQMQNNLGRSQQDTIADRADKVGIIFEHSLGVDKLTTLLQEVVKKVQEECIKNFKGSVAGTTLSGVIHIPVMNEGTRSYLTVAVQLGDSPIFVVEKSDESKPRVCSCYLGHSVKVEAEIKAYFESPAVFEGEKREFIVTGFSDWLDETGTRYSYNETNFTRFFNTPSLTPDGEIMPEYQELDSRVLVNLSRSDELRSTSLTGRFSSHTLPAACLTPKIYFLKDPCAVVLASDGVLTLTEEKILAMLQGSFNDSLRSDTAATLLSCYSRALVREADKADPDPGRRDDISVLTFDLAQRGIPTDQNLITALVCDGHGERGDEMSQFVAKTFTHSLIGQLRCIAQKDAKLTAMTGAPAPAPAADTEVEAKLAAVVRPAFGKLPIRSAECKDACAGFSK